MKKNRLIIFLFIVLLGCKTNEYNDIFKLSFKDSSLLRFHVTNCNDTVNFNFFYNTYFPFGQSNQAIYFFKDSVYSYRIQINHPVTIILLDNKRTQYISFFSLPEDTLDIFLNVDTSQKFSESIKYSGKTASISNYLTKGKLEVGPCPRKKDGIDFYNKQIDTLTRQRLNALNEFNKKEKLPDWYLNFEMTNIEYLGANDKINQFSQRLGFFNQYISRPSDFIENLGVKIDNPKAKFCEGYLSILCSLRPEKYDTLLQQEKVNDSIVFQYIYDNIDFAKNYLKDNMPFFLASRISSLLNPKKLMNLENSSSYIEKVDSLIASVKPLFIDTTLYSDLLDYRDEQILACKKNNTLGKGNKAFNFSLKGVDERTIELSDFTGQLVLINFWATWCAPCIVTIDEKNKLFHDYNKKGLILLSVCLDSNKDKWKEIINDKHFLGTHIICKGDWQNILSKNYNINGIPHYALIDKNGNIISNKIANLTIVENLIREELK